MTETDDDLWRDEEGALARVTTALTAVIQALEEREQAALRKLDEAGEEYLFCRGAAKAVIAALEKERDEARAETRRWQEGCANADHLLGERDATIDRLRAALEPTVENLDHYARVLCNADSTTEAELRALLADIRARAGLPAKEPP